jgi:glycerophosphoryl diester phosphodiesterase
MLDLRTREKGRVLVIGHRGAMGYAPENTFASFNLGLEMGADMLELDVHLCRDGHLVVIHDALLDRTTTPLPGTSGVAGCVEELTLEQIRQVDAGVKFSEQYRGERIPTLPEVLDWARGQTPLVIEIKGCPQPAPGLEEKLVADIAAAGMTDEVLVSSFYHTAVRRVKDLEPRLATGLNYNAQLADTVGAARAAGAGSVWPGWTFWSAEIVAQVHAAGLAAGCYSDEPPEVSRGLLEMGLDALASNYPDRLRALVDLAGLGRKR